MKSVRYKIMAVLALAVGLYVALESTFQRAVIRPSFEALQNEVAEKEMQQCRSILENELTGIARTTLDWSAWDDTYAFVADRNAEYVTSNLNRSAFESNKLHVIYVVDTDGRIVWGKALDPGSRRFFELPELSQQALYRMPELYRHESTESRRSGIFVAERCPILLCSSPIMTSEHRGPVRGAVVMGRFLEKQYIKDLGKLLGVDFDVTAGKAEKIEGMVMTREQGGRAVQIVSTMPDIFGSSCITIQARVETPIAGKAREAGMFMSISTIIAGGMTLCLTYWLLRRTVLARLGKLDECIAAVTKTGDVSHRTDVRGDDELGRLGESLNRMLERMGETEKALSVSDERFRSAFFEAPFPAMIHSEDGKVLQMNRKWTDVTGYTLKDIPTVETWVQKAHGKGKAGDQPGSAMLIDGVCSVRTRTGKLLIWEFHSGTLGTSSEGTCLTMWTALDITGQEAAERRLHDSESKYRCLSENIPAITYTGKVDRNATVTYISPQARKYFGYSAEEFIKTPNIRKTVIHPEDYERVVREYYKACIERGAFSCDYRALGRDGGIIWVREEAQVIDTADGPVAQGVIFDISQSKALEMKVREANAKLMETDKLKTEFLVNVSHELRTPMTICRNVISNAIANVYGPLPAALKDNIGICEESIGRLSRIVSDFLDMSKIEGKKVKLELVRIDVNTICQQVVKSAMAAASARGVALRCYPTPQPVSVNADRERLTRALTNLVSNGVKFAPETTGRVEVHVKPRRDVVVVEVRDNGRGIEAGDMDKLFKRFVQLEQPVGPGAHGTGLGLAISKELVELHGGKIWAESKPGHGAVFSFSLPLADFLPGTGVAEQDVQTQQEAKR